MIENPVKYALANKMKKISQSIINNSTYAEFTGENERIISDLLGSIKALVSEMENTTAVYDSKISELFHSININNAVLSHFKNSEGIELILKLHAVVEKCRRNTGENSELLAAAEHLLMKLDSFKENLFKTAVTESISETPIEPVSEDSTKIDNENLKYKWITFERNSSRFITDFISLEIRDYNQIHAEDPGYIYYNDRKTGISDLMKSPDAGYSPPAKIIIIDSGKRIYAADYAGREILSSNDIITPIIQPLEYSGTLYSGRVRLFGIQFLVIRHDE